ncbi:MAG: CMP-N-acetylneuraminic acid synthetase [Lachnospiraceae bacterium]|nr:CMP-N-acetylneuraminic acid synthetase [Lachnospiraceae bacterium]MDD7628491.1 CMP-N-acetylneuraminic acid synthetase [Lachnospiraceae bacterium]MDY4120017.1 CMP-N-acetylneuraminic acid synthetase [Lachnospiraceae bacterium]
MRTVACVPIKLNNERTPGKNTKAFFDGTTLIECALKTLVKVKGIDDIYVFCSDHAIKKYLIKGVKFLERPKYLDTKDATPQDIIQEFMKLVDADIYMISHVTSPFVKREHFEECIEAVANGNNDSSFTAERIQKLLWSDSAMPINFDPQNVPRTQDLKPIYDEVSAAYVFTKEVFQMYRRRIGINPHITEVTGIECIDIDYPEDFDIANAVYKEIIKGEIK